MMDGLDVKSDLSIYEGTVSALHDKSNGGMILKKRQLAVSCDQRLYAELGRDLVTACCSVWEESPCRSLM